MSLRNNWGAKKYDGVAQPESLRLCNRPSVEGLLFLRLLGRGLLGIRYRQRRLLLYLSAKHAALAVGSIFQPEQLAAVSLVNIRQVWDWRRYTNHRNAKRAYLVASEVRWVRREGTCEARAGVKRSASQKIERIAHRPVSGQEARGSRSGRGIPDEVEFATFDTGVDEILKPEGIVAGEARGAVVRLRNQNSRAGNVPVEIDYEGP